MYPVTLSLLTDNQEVMQHLYWLTREMGLLDKVVEHDPIFVVQFNDYTACDMRPVNLLNDLKNWLGTPDLNIYAKWVIQRGYQPITTGAVVALCSGGYYVCQVTVSMLQQHLSFLDDLSAHYQVGQTRADGEIRVGPFHSSDRAREALGTYQQWLTQEPARQEWPAYVG